MEKRYQVFISSTFEDLQEERKEVIQALLELDCIPAGMELFPAADDDQWTLIRKVIDDCDYYIVIIGGRYGSLSPSGISYTQMEYEYADSLNKPIIGFLHKKPETIASGKSEQSEEGQRKLDAFRAIVKKKTCSHWSSPSQLGAVVSRSLIKLIKDKPAVGWIRADALLDESNVEEILSSRKRKVTDEISNIAKELSRIKESLSTSYIGRISDYLPQVISEIKHARRNITILCDFPAYGYFTGHNNYNKYRMAIREKIDNPSINVRLMCLDQTCRAESNRKVLAINEAKWEEWKRDKEHNALFYKLGYSRQAINKLSMEKFLEALEEVDQEMLNVYCKGASIEEVNALLTFDFWLFDDKRLIFAFSTYAGGESQHGFFTEDRELISAFKEIRDRYHRQNAEGDNKG
jgi:hypothetical protein